MGNANNLKINISSKKHSYFYGLFFYYLFIIRRFIILLTSIFTFFFFGEIRNLTTFCLLPLVNNGFSLSSFFLSLLSFLWIGAQFPQEKFLSYGRILTLHYYFLLMCILFSFFNPFLSYFMEISSLIWRNILLFFYLFELYFNQLLIIFITDGKTWSMNPKHWRHNSKRSDYWS